MNNAGIEIKVELALDQLKRVREDLKSIESKLDQNYVTRGEHSADLRLINENLAPIKRIVYGLVSIIVTAVVVALVSLVVVQ